MSVPAAADTYTVATLGDSGAGSLRQAILDANDNIGSDVIVFAPNLTGAIILTTGQLSINGSVDIQGPGASALTVSGNIASRIFDIATGSIVTMSGLTLKDGYTGSEYGGGTAIYNYGTLTLNGLVVTENEHRTDSDAALAAIVNDGTLTINDSTFSKNTSVQTESYGAYGGAVLNSGTLVINRSTFSRNAALGYADRDSGSEYEWDYTGKGGAVYSQAGKLTINDSTFSENDALRGAAVVAIGGTALSINRCTFSSNTRGGALWSSGSNAEIIDSTFSKNATIGSGGAIWRDGAGTLTIRGSTFSENTALTRSEDDDINYGGGALFLGSESVLDMSNSTVVGNISQLSGGGMYLSAWSPAKSITNITVSGNSAVTTGGGIYQNGNTLTLMNSTIVGNTANEGTGGGVYAEGGLVIGNNIIAGNLAKTSPTLHSTGTFRSRGHNIFGESGTSGLSAGTDATDLMLAGTLSTVVGDLADNGGAVYTHGLVDGGPAVNAGDNSLIPTGITTDARGEGFPRIADGTVDIGAVEVGGGPSTFTLNVAKSGGNGSVKSTPASIDCGGTCAADFEGDTAVALNAVADTGYKFTGWSGDCSGTAAKCSLTIDADKNVTALFASAPVKYLLTTKKAGTGTGTISSTGSYEAGATVKLKATPATGSTFAGWKPAPCAASFVMPAKALTCTATFNRVEATTYGLKVLIAGTGNGTVTGEGKYAAGASVKLKATPAKGSTFVAWAPSACAASFFMPSRPLTCVAIFSSTNYSVSTVVGGAGTGTVTGSGNYAAGATVKLKATPTAGSTFVGWSPAPCAASFVMPNRPIVCAAIFN